MTNKYEELADRLENHEAPPTGSSYDEDIEVASAIRELLALVKEMDEALKPFADLIPSTLYAEDGSEHESYTIILFDPKEYNAPDFTSDDFARARVVHQKAVEALRGQETAPGTSGAEEASQATTAANS